MKKANFKTEAALAAHIIAWLRPLGWEIYQEVPWHGCADIVATRGPLVWVIECKLRLNFEVIDQARGWAKHAHLASVAVPGGGSYNRRAVVGDILSTFGLGMLEANEQGSYAVDDVTQRIAPLLRRRVLPGLRESLCEEHKTFAAAGSPTGRSWTPWKNTCHLVRLAVANKPGITLKEAVDSTRHHYHSNASARASLARGIEGGIVEGIRLEREGKLIRLYPELLAEPTRPQVLGGAP